MQTIQVNLGYHSYPVYVGRNILQRVPRLLAKVHPATQVAVITSQLIDDLYGAKVREEFGPGQQVITFRVPDGEQAKTLKQVEALYTGLLEHHFERNAVIIALGGGVIGDLAGFIAATYLRGIPFIQVPTTLLAQVDSSIGGKVGVNHPLGKNLIGAFKQPLFVLSDVMVLQTLPEAELRSGLGEVIKYGFIRNARLFEYLEKKLTLVLKKDLNVLQHVVLESAEIKARVVEEDEQESSLRMILNFGHTFGHALEAEYGFKGLKHGEAVILGMKCAVSFEKQTGSISEPNYRRMLRLLDKVKIDFDRSKMDPDRLLKRIYHDKKVKNRRVRLILVDEPGQCRIETVDSDKRLKRAFEVLLHP